MELTLHKDNPYANGRITVFEDFTTTLERPFSVIPENSEYRLHTVKEGEFLDEIATKYYPQAENPAWYSLMLADINDIDFPIDAKSYEGKALIIPAYLTLELMPTDIFV